MAAQPPPYDALHGTILNDTTKEKQEEVTLYHSQMLGRQDSHPLPLPDEHQAPEKCAEFVIERTVMLPAHISKISVAVSERGVHGLTIYTQTDHVEQHACEIGQTDTAGTTAVNFHLNEGSHLLHRSEHISAIATRFYRPNIDFTYLAAIEFTTTRGRSSGWIGRGDHSDSAFAPYTESLEGKIVGLRCEAVQGASHPLTRLGCVSAKKYGDYSGFMPETGAPRAQAEPSAEDRYMQEWRREYPFDTGRWTGNRGLGLRWSADRRKLEIYQGSNDPTNRH